MLYFEVTFSEYQKDGDTKALMFAIQRVADVRGGITKLAKETKLNRQNLYRIFSNKTSPRFDTITKILKALGIVMSFKILDVS